MANSAQLIAKTPYLFKSGIQTVWQYSCSIDTTGTDLVIHNAKGRIYVVGLAMSETSATNLSFFAQSDVSTTDASRTDAPMGTISQTNGSAVLTGVGTNFTKDILGTSKYQIIVTGGSTLTVLTVDSDEQITATGTATGNVADATYKRRIALSVPELAANQGIWYPIDGSWIMSTWEGDSLIIRASVAVSDLLVSLVDTKVLR